MAIANSDGSIIITTKLDVTPVSKALNALKGKFRELKEQRAAVQSLTTAIKDQQFVIKQLSKELGYQIAIGKGNSGYAEELREKIKGLKIELNQLTSAASTMGVKIAAASTKAAQGLKQFGKRIAGIVKSALIFSVLYRVMQSVVKLFQNILMSDEEFRQDWEELKAAFYTAAYPIINLIVPAIKWIVQQVRDWAVSIGKVAAALQGMSYSELVDQAKASKEAADNYADMEKSSKKTADNVKKQLASFDQIQTLSSGDDEEQDVGIVGFENIKEYDSSGTKSMLGDIMSAIGGALMAVGLILLFHGQIAFGIGFIIAGAFGIAAATLTDESVSQKAKDELSNAMLIVGVVAIVLGILLCMAAQWGIGIGLVVLGVASIVAPIALNWDGIKEQLQTSFGGWLVLGGIIAIVLGILLCFNPVTLPLGIGLIFLGAGSIVAPIVANWDAILGWLKKAWDAVKAFWNRNIAPVFTARFWLNLAKNCGNGLIAGFEGAINGIVWLFEKMINFIADGLNKISIDVPSWVPGIGGKKFGFNVPRASFGRVSIPRLAQGAVIPPNREFLAVLGDNKKEHEIVSPLSTMKQAFLEALMTTNINGGQDNRPIILQIDGREIARATREGNASLGSQTVFGGFANAY